MTRINTNVSSLQAQINLSRNNNELQTALTRLSTGLRINSGKDDPAGLIASETLRSDIMATEVGITNSERANQMIATADSALGQVSGLLIDIRGLVNEAANTGAMSAAQIAANQLQVDSSLDAIDRISQVTQFQGSRLIDGSLDFTTESVNSAEIDSVQIDQASFGSNPTIGVNVELISQATKADLTYNSGQTTDDLVLQVGGTEGFQAFNFDAGTSVSDMASAINLVSEATGVTAEAQGALKWDAHAAVATVANYGDDNDITITAATAGEASGAYYVRYFQATVAGSSTSAAITESEVDAQGNITQGYVDVTLGTDGVTSTVFSDITQGVTSPATLASGTIDLTNIAGGDTMTWTAAAGFEGDLGAPIITVADTTGADTSTYDAGTNTFTVHLSGAAVASGGLDDILNAATGDTVPFTFTSAGATNMAVASDAGAAPTVDGANGVEAGFTLNAETITPGAAGDAGYSIVFTNGTGAASYNTGTNVYTIELDQDGGTYTMTSAALRDELNGIANREHTFNVDGSDGTQELNAALLTAGAGAGGDWTMVDATATVAAITTNGSDGGTANATANDVIEAINTAQDAMVTAGTIDARLFSVANQTGSDGTGSVTATAVVAALTGSDPGQEPDANNMVQYLALDGMRDISYVASGKNTALSIDLNTYEPEYAQASAIIDLGIADTTFQLRAKDPGEAGNGDITISWGTATDATTVATYAGSTLTINLANDDSATVNSVMAAIETSATASAAFDVSLAKPENAPATVPTVGDGTGLVTATAFSGTTTDVTLAGGVVSKGTMVVNLATDANGNVTTTANDLISFVEASSEQVLKDFQLQIDSTGGSDGTGLLAATTTNVKFDPPGTTYTDAYATGDTHAANGSAAQFTVTAKTAGSAYDDVMVRVVSDASLTSGTGAVEFLEDSNTLLVSYNGNVTAEDVSYLINQDDTVGAMFEAAPTAGEGAGTGNVAAGDFVKLSGGETRTVPDPTTYTPPLAAGAPMVELVGGQDAGEDLTDAKLTFNASNYGSSSFVSVKAISGTFAVTDTTGATVDRSYGTDVEARINGITAVGDGLNASLSTASLQMQVGIDVNMTVGDTSSFSITGGGAQFQLGPDVVSNQQARLGIMSVSSATLGGINGNGRLFQLRSGENYDLSTDTTGAAAVVNDVITQVTGLRGRLGAFQKTTLETNIASLQDTLETLTAAESSIRDADFAEESSALTRAQILVQSSTKVLGIANQGPQNVLSLIQ